MLEAKLGATNMNRILAAILVLSASAAQAGHLDVISFTLKDGCSLGQYRQIVGDFNEWGKAHGYQTEIAWPMFGDDMETHYWLGRSADNAAFGKAADAWLAGQADADSVPAQLNARFGECQSNSTRRAYGTFP
ncbi:MAG: hypothetical protein RQ741_14170 [Wenzhouxiangellaceae bacterium]|nr:hypothetical protein [Wenzhouxiangellaceae bacterium]